jgi:GNAT superfamily N-acetyltransferase
MDRIVIAPVMDSEIALLDTALRQLAADLGDRYTADQDALSAAVCGPEAGCLALLAMRDGEPIGTVFAAPIFSTMRGGAGLFVTDLWVAESARGEGLGRKLLAGALREGTKRNAALFMKLAVYQDNSEARTAYEKLGFAEQATEAIMILAGRALETLKATR